MNNPTQFGVEELDAQAMESVNGGCGTFCGAVVGAIVAVLWGDWDDFKEGRAAAAQ
jgi:lactobin A/cerein 7B family class IIb bacteriocin